MSQHCSFLAPNGEKSLLYAALEQKVGADKATQLWSLSKSREFQKQFSDVEKDSNGEVVADALLSVFTNDSKPTAISKDITIPLSFNTMNEFTKTFGKIVELARKNPEITYKFPFTPATKLSIEGKRYDGDKLANLLYSETLPTNLVFDQTLQARMFNLPRVFTKGLVMEINDPLEFDEAAMKRQMDDYFVRVRDDNGEMTDKYFDLEKQNEIIDMLMYMLYNNYNHPKLQGPRWKVIGNHKDLILQGLQAQFEFYSNPEKYGTEGILPDQAKEIAGNYRMVLNAFYTPGQKNNFWEFTIKAMEGLGFRVKGPLDTKTNDIEETSDEEIQESNGQSLRDWYSSSFELDPRDTASVRMKMFLMSIEKSKIGDELKPRQISLAFNNEDTRRKIITKEKQFTIRAADTVAKHLKLTALSGLPLEMSGTERNRRSEAIATIEASKAPTTVVRATATHVINAEEAEQFREQMEAEEGYTPKAGDVFIKLEHYQQRKNILSVEKNIMGTPKLAGFDSVFMDMVSLLADRKPGYSGYLKALQESGKPELMRAAQKLEAAPKHIQNEFVAVMSKQYQQMMMILFRKSFNGFLEGRVINANRASEVDTLISQWKENQKASPILNRDEAGIVRVDRRIAEGFYETLKELQERQITNARERAKLDEDWFDLFKAVLEDNGINLSDQALNQVKQMGPQLGKNTTLGGAGYQGITALLIKRLYIGAGEVTVQQGEDEFGEEADIEPFKVNNPLYTEGTAMRILANIEANYTDNLHSQTLRNSEGKTIYAYGLNTALSHAIRQITDDGPEGEAYRNRFTAAYNKESWLLNFLRTGGTQGRGRFKLAYLDGIKNEFGTRDGVTRPEMSDREQWLTVLSLFHNRGNSQAHYVSLTHSDKTTTPVFLNGPREYQIFNLREGKHVYSKNILDKVVNHVFIAEYNRIRESQKKQAEGGAYDLKNYNEGSKYFYALPLFNYENMVSLQQKGALSPEDVKAIWVSESKLNDQTHPLFSAVVRKLIAMQLTAMTSETMDSWQRSGLLEAGLPGTDFYLNRLMRNAGYVNNDGKYSDKAWVNDNEKPVDPETVKSLKTRLAAAEYTVNSFLFNVSGSQLFYGDPALAWKGSINKTLIEYGKRLAKDIAPGTDGNWEGNSTYNAVTIEEYTPLVEELKGIPGYESAVEGSDAAELTTVKEQLDVLFALGKNITQEQYERAIDIINHPDENGYYSFEADPELDRLVRENITLQIDKPVVAGLMETQDGVMRYDYVKSASMALYPPMIAGMELDKLRKAMEAGNVQRVNFSTAKKLGAPAVKLSIFNADNTINEKAFQSSAWTGKSTNGATVPSARQVMNRDNFRIQQDVPYDATKEEIRMVSQMNKLIAESIATIRHPFKFEGAEYTGQQIRDIKEDIRKKLITIAHQRFLDEIGATEKDGTITVSNRKKLYERLKASVLSTKGYSLNDTAAIQSFVNNSDELTLPLIFTPSAGKFESLLMSMIKDVTSMKMPGKSYVQASPAGFKLMKTWEESNLDRNNIVWTKPFTGNLQTAHIGEDGRVVPAQVLVSFNYFTKNGQRIDIRKFIKEVDGKKMIDTDKLLPELFQLIGARIPNQKHSSMLPIEIVGFLPETMADTIVVPAGITRQMGADFDVDKLYTYKRSYQQTGDQLSVAGTTEADTDEEVYLKNRYFDIHWSVLTNPEMLPRMMSPLDIDDLKAEAEKRAKKGVDYYFGPTYQLNDFQSMKDAKRGVGSSSLAVTNNAVVQDKNLWLGTMEIDEETGDVRHISKPITINGVEYTHLSGYANTLEKRTKTDTLVNIQSEFVDNARNRVVGSLNLNSFTTDAAYAMSRLQTLDSHAMNADGTSELTPGQAISSKEIVDLLTQPIIIEYAARMARQSDSLSSASANAQQVVYEALAKDYAQDAPQLEHLNLFKALDEIGQQLTTLQTLTTTDTRGAGKSLLDTLSLAEKRSRLGVNAYEYKIQGMGTVFFNNEAETEVGALYRMGNETAIKVFSADLPYQKLTSVFDIVRRQSGREELGRELKETLFDGLRSYVFGSSRLQLWSDAYKERIRLLFNINGNDSLAKRVAQAKESWGKHNYFLQRLHTQIDPTELKPDLIKYEASKALQLDDEENVRGWLNLLSSADEEQKRLGEDLIRYSYLTGGLQSADNFVKYIPFSYISGTQIGHELRNVHARLEEHANNPVFIEQFFQHNPMYTKQLGAKLKESGVEYETAPDSFKLPGLSDSTENPASNLVVRVRIGSKEVNAYPNYLSYRDGKQWVLYKKRSSDFDQHGVRYTRIDTLGSKTVSEYNENSEEQRSVFTENRANNYEYMTPEYRKIEDQDVHMLASKIGIFKNSGNYNDITQALSVIAADTQQPDHIRALSSMLESAKRMSIEADLLKNFSAANDLTLSIGKNGRSLGTLDSMTGVLTLNPKMHSSKQELAGTLLHELLHYHTAFTLTALEDESVWATRGISARSQASLRKIREQLADTDIAEKAAQLTDLRKIALDKLRNEVIAKEGVDGWAKRQAEVSSGTINGQYSHLLYGLSSNTEFITHLFTDGAVIEYLNNIPHSEKKSLLGRIRDLISELWSSLMDALGVREDSLMEEAVHKALEILTYDKASDFKADNSMTGMDSIINASFSDFSPIQKIIGKLEEQKSELIRSYTGVTKRGDSVAISRKIRAIEADIRELQEDADLLQVASIGKRQLSWVNSITNNTQATANQLMTAVRLNDVWNGVIDLIYGNESVEADADLMQIQQQANRNRAKLNARLRDYMTDISQGTIKPADWLPSNLQDLGKYNSQIRSMSSAAHSQVLQHISGFVETTGRQRDEEARRIVKALRKLEKDMLAHSGGKTQLQALYNKLMQQNVDENDTKTWGLVQQYSSQWFSWRQQQIAKRNAILRKYAKDKTPGADVTKNMENRAARALAWKMYWKELKDNAVLIDTRVLFNPETGELNTGIEDYLKSLAAGVGEDHVQTILERAQTRYKEYLNERDVLFEKLQEEFERGELTQEKMDEEKSVFVENYSPNAFFDEKKGGEFTMGMNADKYIVIAPKAAKTEFWDQNYREVMQDEQLKSFYSRYKTMMDTLLSFLPKTVQENAGASFLPAVAKSLVADNLDIKAYFENYSKRFVESVAADGWSEAMNARAYNKIPLEFVDDTVPVADRSRDIIRIAEVFATMATHYRHFSAAKDVIEMGESIIEEIHHAESSGTVQMEQNGKIVTVQKGLENAIKALRYLKEYSVYRKPKALEFSLGGKLFAERTEEGTKYSLNPLTQTAISNKVRDLMVQREKLEKEFLNPEGEQMTVEEYTKQREAIDKQLEPYVGYTLYGSKVGDKLIGINQLKALAFNPFSAVANVSFGLLSVYIHASGRQDFTRGEVNQAFKKLLNLPGSAEQEKIMNLMERLGIMGDIVDSHYGRVPQNRDNIPTWKKLADPFQLMRSSDFFMKGVTTVAHLLHQKIEVETAEGKQTIPLYDAFNTDGEWDTKKYGERPEWSSKDMQEQKAFDKLRNRVIRLNMIIHGNQDKNSPKLLNKSVVGRLIGQFRLSWLPEGWYNRFQDEHFDQQLGRAVKGRYRTIGQLGWGGNMMVLGRSLLNLIPGVKVDTWSGIPLNNGKSLADSAVDVENMHRNLTELGFFLTLSAAILSLRYLGGDDEDKVADGAMKILINQLIRGKQDIDFYVSPSVFDTVTRDFIPASNVIKDYMKLVKATGKLMLDDDYEFSEWMLKMTKAGLPIPEAALVNKVKFMMTKNLDDMQN